MSARLLRRLTLLALPLVVLTAVAGCVKVNVKEGEARALDRTLREQPGVVGAESVAYGGWRSEPKVSTTITLDDHITVTELTDLVVAIPGLEHDAGLDEVAMWRAMEFDSGGPKIDAGSIGATDDRKARERDVQELLKVRAALPAVSAINLGGEGPISYSIVLPDDVPGLLVRAREVAALKLRSPGALWQFGTTHRGTAIEFGPGRQPTAKLVDQWQVAVAALGGVPEGFSVESFEFENSGDLASLRMGLRLPSEIPVQDITPATYGDRLLPLLRRHWALVGDGGSYEVTALTDQLADDEWEPWMISLGNLAAPYGKVPEWSRAWSDAWETALKG